MLVPFKNILSIIIQAGIKANKLKIGLEPEAASICCQHLKTERSTSGGLANSPIGTKYMVIDIGGMCITL